MCDQPIKKLGGYGLRIRIREGWVRATVPCTVRERRVIVILLAGKFFKYSLAFISNYKLVSSPVNEPCESTTPGSERAIGLPNSGVGVVCVTVYLRAGRCL